MNTDQPYSNLLLENGAMGSWKLSAHCSAFIIGSGIQALKNKVGTSTFSLNYNWLLNEIQKHPKKKSYNIKGLSPVILSKALMQDKELGAIEEVERTINILCEIKREYKNEPTNGEELLGKQYDSFPLDISRLNVFDLEKEDE